MNNLFILYFEATVEVLVAIYLNVDQENYETNSDKFAHGLGYYLMFPYGVVIPTVIVYVISKTPEELKKKKTINKWELIYKDLNINSKLKLFWSLLYILRRLVLFYILLIQWFQNHISIQIILLVYSNAFVLMYKTWILPFNTR